MSEPTPAARRARGVVGALFFANGALVAWISTVAIAANIALLGVAPSWLALAGVLAIAGALDAFADIGANAHGLRVERRYGRSILNSLHGVWSIGAVAGGSMGALATGLGVAVSWHLAGAGLVFAASRSPCRGASCRGPTIRRRRRARRWPPR